MLPQDPVILLSTVNTRLRDNHPDLDDFCKTHGVTPEHLKAKLSVIDYHYDPHHNQFK